MSDPLLFSHRYGYRHRGPDPEIIVREDAPDELRYGLVKLADNLGMTPHRARDVVCGILIKQPDPNNWSAYPNVFEEVQYLVSDAPWYRIYDIAEAFYKRFADDNHKRAQAFEDQLNELFCVYGIGWTMQGGRIIARGSETFAVALKTASTVLKETGRQTAAREIHEALADISRRPSADVTGAIQHAMAALECVSRDVTGQPSENLGQLIPTLNLPKPLDMALIKLWGFASQQGRHIQEGRGPRFEDAELVVTVASAVSIYLLRSDQGRQ